MWKSFLLILCATLVRAQSQEKPIPPPGISISAEDRAELEKGLAELTSATKAVAQHPREAGEGGPDEATLARQDLRLEVIRAARHPHEAWPTRLARELFASGRRCALAGAPLVRGAELVFFPLFALRGALSQGREVYAFTRVYLPLSIHGVISGSLIDRPPIAVTSGWPLTDLNENCALGWSRMVSLR